MEFRIRTIEDANFLRELVRRESERSGGIVAKCKDVKEFSVVKVPLLENGNVVFYKGILSLSKKNDRIVTVIFGAWFFRFLDVYLCVTEPYNVNTK